MDRHVQKSPARKVSCIPTSSNNIERLVFEFGFIHIDILVFLVASARRLKSFAANFRSQSIREEKFSLMHPSSSTLSRALEPHKDSLERIFVDWDANACNVFREQWYHLFPTLSHFTALKSLTSRPEALFEECKDENNQDQVKCWMLPPSLGVLRITSLHNQKAKLYLERLAAYNKTAVHNLQEVWVPDLPNGSQPDPAWEWTKDLFVTAQINYAHKSDKELGRRKGQRYQEW